MKKIRTIIFDFDGVIADTLPFTFKRLIEIAKFLEVKDKSEKEIINEIRSKSFKEILDSEGFNIAWLKLPFVFGMIRKMQMELGKEMDKITVFPGIKKLLQKLKKEDFRLFIISSNIKENIEKFIKINKLEYFDHVHGKSNVLGKAGEIEDLLKICKLDKNKVVYVGDEIRDVDACKKVGIKIIGVSWGLNKKESLVRHGADFIANKPSQILKIVSK